MVWIFIGIIAAALLGWYLYQRSKEDTAEDSDQAVDAEANNDEFEDLLLTGLMLNQIYNDENDDSSEDMDANEQNLMDGGGFDDSGGLE